MELKGRYDIAAPRNSVWQMINDSAVLQACIPGCEEVIKDSPSAESFKLKLNIQFGPLSAKYSGKCHISDSIAPECFTITTKRKGAVLGTVNLQFHETNGKTSVDYHAQFNLSGKFMWFGGMLISKAAKKLIEQFFVKLAGIAEAEI
jgi:uncharacterized protein